MPPYAPGDNVLVFEAGASLAFKAQPNRALHFLSLPSHCAFGQASPSPSAAVYLPASYFPLSRVPSTPTSPVTFRIEQGFSMAHCPTAWPSPPVQPQLLPTHTLHPKHLGLVSVLQYSVFPPLFQVFKHSFLFFDPSSSEEFRPILQVPAKISALWEVPDPKN